MDKNKIKFTQIVFLVFFLWVTFPVFSQVNEPAEIKALPEQISVKKQARDQEIKSRILKILKATQWYQNIDVEVEEGIVTINGEAESDKNQKWAGTMAEKIDGVIAVVNQLVVRKADLWSLKPIQDEWRGLAAKISDNSQLILAGLLILVLTFIGTHFSVKLAQMGLKKRFDSPLLRRVISRLFAIPIFVIGIYFVLKITNLTSLAVTVLGGTGLIGIVVGFAFRDIAENFLASILVSMQRPFVGGDLISVAGYKGYVQSVNTRSTLLMTLEGNHVQIPNATIYKQSIVNYTANPKERVDFLVGVGYDVSISHAQSIALKVLQEHPAVFNDPEPLILAEELASATVNLRFYFWIDVEKYSVAKVRSAVIRIVKQEFEQNQISMPDDAREVVFPHGVPVTIVKESQNQIEASYSKPEMEETQVHAAEGDLSSEEDEIQKQADTSRKLEDDTDFLQNH